MMLIRKGFWSKSGAVRLLRLAAIVLLGCLPVAAEERALEEPPDEASLPEPVCEALRDAGLVPGSSSPSSSPLDLSVMATLRARLATDASAANSKLRACIPDIPAPIDWIGTVVNLRPTVLLRPEEWTSRDVLFTDLAARYDQYPNQLFPDAVTAFEEGLPEIEKRSPRATIGTYLSGSDVKAPEYQSHYPDISVPLEPFETLCDSLNPPCDRDDPSGVFLRHDFIAGDSVPRSIINIAHEQAGPLMADLIVEEITSRGQPLVFLDNIRHPLSGGGFAAPWEDQTRWLAGVRDRLHAAGTRMIINLTLSPPRMPEEDLVKLSDAVDGVTLEVPLHPIHDRHTAPLVEQAIADYRYLLNRGTAVVMIPLCTGTKDPSVPSGTRTCTAEETAAEPATIIAFAAALYEPGDRLFVSRPFFEEPHPWLGFPESFGYPLAPADVVPGAGDSPPTITRKFENGVLRVTPAEREATFIPRDGVELPDTSIEVQREIDAADGLLTGDVSADGNILTNADSIGSGAPSGLHAGIILDAQADIGIGSASVACDLGCFALETEYDGPGGRRTRLHRNLSVSLEPLTGWAIDVDGNQPPARAIGPVVPGLGYELVVSLGRNSEVVPSEDDFTLRIDKVIGAPLLLPVRTEIISGDLDGETENSTIGYDALDSTAPASFELRITKSFKEVEIDDWTQTEDTIDANLGLNVSGSTLAIVTETFTGTVHGGVLVRPLNRSRTRVEFGAPSAAAANSGPFVPSSVGLFLFNRSDPVAPAKAPDGERPPDGFLPGSAQFVVDHDGRTKLDLERVEADGTRITGTIDELPRSADLRLTSEDLNGDLEPGTNIAYSASAVADVALALEEPIENDEELVIGSTITTASIDDVPATIEELSFEEVRQVGGPQDGEVIGGDIVYLASSQARTTGLSIEDTVEQTRFEVTLPELPARIERLRWRTPKDHASIGYRASATVPSATVTLRDDQLPEDDPFPEGDWRWVRTAVTNVPGAFDIDVTLKNRKFTDANGNAVQETRGVVYKASSDEVDVEVTGRSNRPFMEGRTAEEAPDDVALRRSAGADRLRLTLTGVPKSVCAASPSTDVISITGGGGGLTADGSEEPGHCDDGENRIESAIGFAEFQLTSLPEPLDPNGPIVFEPPASRDTLTVGLDGLLLRDGIFSVSGDGDGAGLSVPGDFGGEEIAPKAMFVAFVRAHDLREISVENHSIESLIGSCPPALEPEDCKKADFGFDLQIGTGGDHPVVLDWVRDTGPDVVWQNGEDEEGKIERDATEVISAVVPDPPSHAEVSYRAYPGDLDSNVLIVENGFQFHYGANEISDPTSGEAALTFEQRTIYDARPDVPDVPVVYATKPAQDDFQDVYSASDFNGVKQVSLDILPAGLAPDRALYVCRAEGHLPGKNNICTKDVFTAEDFPEDFGPDEANQGSLRIRASSPTSLSFFEESVGREGFRYIPVHVHNLPAYGALIAAYALGQFDGCTFVDRSVFSGLISHVDAFILCEDSKPGKAIKHLDRLRSTNFGLQFHSTEDDCCGFIGGWLGGKSEKGYLALDTGWTGDCVNEDGEPEACHGGSFHDVPPEAMRASGLIDLKPDVELPSDDPDAWDFQDNGGTTTLAPVGQEGAMKLGAYFAADRRVLEADPGDAGLVNLFGGLTWWDDLKEHNVAIGRGHAYCGTEVDDPLLRTQWSGALEEIGDFYCRKSKHRELPPE